MLTGVVMQGLVGGSYEAIILLLFSGILIFFFFSLIWNPG